MNTPCKAVVLISTLLVSVSVFGQPAVRPAEEAPALGPPEMTPSRVLAGLRGYADPVVEALAQLAEHPEVLQSAAEAVEAGREPAAEAADVTPALRDALKTLSQTPAALLIAATYPEELQLLHSLQSVAPEGVALRLEQLRRAYEEAGRAAAHDWQWALENDPVALGEYRDLLTQYCEAAREADAAFAYVRVTDRRYYYACPPDEALVFFAEEAGLPRSLYRVLARWWEEHAPQSVDAQVTRTRVPGPDAVDPGDFIYDWPAAERTPLWQTAEAGDGERTLGLVPVILQPPADQPPAARLAWAVSEHARLWTPPMPVIALEGPEAEVGAAPDEEEPVIVVEEPIPGPQTARHERLIDVGVSELEPPAEAWWPYTGYYYGYPWAAPYYCSPTYYYFSGSVLGPHGVCYGGGPYYLGGVHLRAGHVGRRAYSSSRTGTIHYRDGRHYGRLSVSAAGRSDRRLPRVYTSTPGRGYSTRIYRTRTTRPVLRQHSVYHRRAISPIRRSGLGTRVIRPGLSSVSTARRQALLSRTGAIRAAGSHPAHSSPRVIRPTPRSGGRAIRPPSQTVRPRSGSAVRGRGGGVHRR
jgi:hypothetical protein